MNITAPSVNATVLISNLTEPPTTAAITRVIGYDDKRSAWQVAIAKPTSFSSGSTLQHAESERTAWIKRRVSYPVFHTLTATEWGVVDISEPLPVAAEP